jgi:hypothetical protein
MSADVKPIRSRRDYEAAPEDVERLWAARQEHAMAEVAL